MTTRKVTLYLGDSILSALDRFRGLYFFSGLTVSEVPDASDVIEAAVSWESFYLNTDPLEGDILRKYIGKEDSPGWAGETMEGIKTRRSGRFLFPLKEYTQKELDAIRERWSFKGSDAMLIRQVVERIFKEEGDETLPDWGSIFVRTFFGYLYGLTLRESIFVNFCSRNKITIDGLLSIVPPERLDAVRAVVLEEGKIDRLRDIVEKRKIRAAFNGFFGVDFNGYYEDHNLLFNREFTFNYLDAYIGFLFVVNDFGRKIRKASIPPDFIRLLRWFNLSPPVPKGIRMWFFSGLESLLELSKELNKYL